MLLVNRVDAVDGAMRYGITVTKKIGGAVVRNRMKRRFRALLREVLPVHGLAGADHVLIGRDGGIERDFAKLREELLAALARAAAAHEAGADPHRAGLAAGAFACPAAVVPVCAVMFAVRDRGVAEARRD